MDITDVDYTHTLTEIEEMRQLLIKSHNTSLKPFNWRLALLENWFYASRYLEPTEYFTSRVHLWRNDAGQLVAFVIRGKSFTNFQVDYDYRFLEPMIFEWAEHNRPYAHARINTMVYNWDTERQELLESRGYTNLGPVEDVRIYDLTNHHQPAVLPHGYYFTTLSNLNDYEEQLELLNRVWGVSLDDDWRRGKVSAPSYSAEWDLIIVAPKGQQAAYSLVWLYPHNCSAEIDPLGTHPDFRKRGLARALVLETFTRLKASGYRYAYIASETHDQVVSHLYASLQPAQLYQGYHWIKA